MRGASAIAVAPFAVCCVYCSEELPLGAKQCPSCLRWVTDPNDTSNVYELTELESEIPAEWQSLPVYTLEMSIRCQHCREPIRTVRIVCLMRTQVSFTTTLGRRGRVMVCTECGCVLSAELAGLV